MENHENQSKSVYEAWNGEPLELTVTLDVAAGGFRFEWSYEGKTTVVGCGILRPDDQPFQHAALWLDFRDAHRIRSDLCGDHASSTRALLQRIRRLFPLSSAPPRLGVLMDVDLEIARANHWLPLKIPDGSDPWKWLGNLITDLAKTVVLLNKSPHGPPVNAQRVMHNMAAATLDVPPTLPLAEPPATPLLNLRVTFDQVNNWVEFTWSCASSNKPAASGWVCCTGVRELTWELECDGKRGVFVTSHGRKVIADTVERWVERFPTNGATFIGEWVLIARDTGKPVVKREPPFGPDESQLEWVTNGILEMAEALRYQFTPMGRITSQMEAESLAEFESYERKLARKEQKRAEEEARRRETMARLAEERRQRELQQEAKKLAAAKSVPASRAAAAIDLPARKERAPLPPVPVQFELPPLQLQETAFPLEDLRGYSLRERAALWWISNQSDDLLCLPDCRIQHLEYQLRTALRVLGPLRGRALLSDEVGLGKTVEAGLIIKELLTRGMVKKFLVLTVPSLVDQWEEELSDKFGLNTATTNQAARNDPQTFWCDNPGIVASLHTLKQPAQLEIARQVPWDILVVDEAHYLRNRDSQAWQAVNALPRHFLLLLTATPVQNSLEELYNLVMLLQPGQLPSPKEFRARFIDPKRPRQPREPEELRRLIGQVMIRNTRANAGLKLPSRRAETVLFEPDESERNFWQQWEGELREALAKLNPGQSSLWGRLLLQTAGSSPAAWRAALERFPNPIARQWREQSPLESSWRRKCELIPPLTKSEGGVVVFTQYLDTQAALAGFLRSAGVETFLINGSTPAPERQPITEDFRKRGGALLLTHSGTEGRNLQFSHQLVNFDLPWNPMEIEQRIGRLHRLGQQRPVRIYNFVQVGTLQQDLLELLQEKLNLFELVVGETGLVLGERFSSDEFAEEIFRRWKDSENVAEAMAGLGEELAAARDAYQEVKQLDETLFAKDYESL